MTTDAKEFSLGAVLSVATGTLLCPIDEIYGILNHMTGDNLFTHQLPRAFRACEPEIKRQYPVLAQVDVSRVGRENWRDFLAERKRELGGQPWLVRPLPLALWTSQDPLTEAELMVGPERVIPLTK
ncbi:MAG: hypothetical protein FD189_1057 [Elusimicrobia bacterium]|nr:MAG: hypothetical protein FD189_1057 [Elusimicrobiota bacterium]